MHTKHLLGHHATVYQHCWGQGVAAVSRRPALHARSEYSRAVLKVDEPRTLQQRLAGTDFGGKFEAEGWMCGARRQSRCAGALLGAWMGDTGGKSGRRPGRHLQVEASGPGNAASVHSAPRVDPNASAWGCASEGWGGSLPVSCPPGADGACEPPRLSIYPADADLQVFFSPAPPIEPCGASSLAQMAGPSVSGAWSFQAHLQASDLGHP